MINDQERSGVYRIINLNDGQNTTYIGSTTQSFQMRWWQHQSDLQHNKHYNAHLQAAWNMYGEEAFEFVILEIVESDKDVLAREQYWLDAYHKRATRLYNVASIAGKSVHGPLPQWWRKKISEAMKGHSTSEETKRKLSTAMTGRKFSEETLRKMRVAQQDKTLTEQHKARISIALKGRKKTREWREKIAKALKGHVVSVETRRKIKNKAARPYPAFFNSDTEEIIPAGRNLKALCQKYGLARSRMWDVMHKRQKSHKGWILLSERS
jgi:group I intron endonuclease